MGAPELPAPMHQDAQGRAQRPCRHCGTPFAPRRAWAEFCKPKCRADFHLAKAHEERARKLAFVQAILAQVGSDADPKAVLAAVERG